MEAMHTRENVKLRVKKSFETLLAFVTGVYLYASILDKTQLIFQLVGIGWIAIHQILQSIYLLTVTLQRFTNLILKVLYFDILIEVWKQVLNFYNLWLLCKLNHLVHFLSFNQVMLCNFNPQFLSLVFVIWFFSVLFSKLFLVVFKSQGDSFRIQIHFSINNDLCLRNSIIFEESKTKIKIKVQSSLFH